MPQNLEAQNIIHKMPKAEFHLHYSGAVPLWYLKSVATDHFSRNEYALLEQGLKAIKQGLDYHEVFKYFLHVYRILNTPAKIVNGMRALAEELLKDNVVYVEVRAGLKDLGGGLEEYLQALLQGIESSPAGITINLLLSLRRNTPAAEAQQIVELAIRYKDFGVIGIDISGDSTLVGTENIITAIHMAKAHGLLLALHLGESNEEIDTPQKAAAQAELLEELQPDRLGHGVFLSKQAVAWLLSHPAIPLEVCPSSSVMAGMIDHHSKHPGLAHHLDHAHPILVCTDDPLFFQSPLTAEYLLLMDAGVTLAQITALISNSFRFATTRSAADQKIAYKCKL